jgi:FtsH-binding integral membrane protein
MFRPGMRAYFIPLAAGVTLAASTFLPWVVVAGVPARGVPGVAALWVLGLGVLSAVLAVLSLITRKNSRHPLLVLGLAALGITYLSWRIMPRLASERAQTVAQAFAIVEGRTLDQVPIAIAGSGLYLGVAASVAIVGFGLTIVIKRASTPYVMADPNDDV